MLDPCDESNDMPGSTSTRQLQAEFWLLWLREQAVFHRMCLKWLHGNATEAEDAMSRGALNAIEHILGGRPPPRNFRPWVLRILYNLCIDSLRRHARHTELPGEGHDAPVGAALPASDLPDGAVLRRELCSSLSAALCALPSRLRPVFELRFIEGLPYDEISRLLTISPQNARKRVQQARGLLRERLAALA